MINQGQLYQSSYTCAEVVVEYGIKHGTPISNTNDREDREGNITTHAMFMSQCTQHASLHSNKSMSVFGNGSLRRG